MKENYFIENVEGENQFTVLKSLVDELKDYPFDGDQEFRRTVYSFINYKNIQLKTTLCKQGEKIKSVLILVKIKNL